MDSATLERVGAVLRLVCTLAAGIATMLGFYTDADELFTGVCCVLALVCLAWCWWKNNNVTDAAITAQAVLDALKEGDLTDLATDLTTGEQDGEQDGEQAEDSVSSGGEDDESEDDPEGDA